MFSDEIRKILEDGLQCSSEVKMLPLRTFLETFDRKISRNRMDLSLYEGYWDCACGHRHCMIQQQNIICQGFWKVIVRCPDDPNVLTAVKVNTKFFGMKFKDYESFAGAVISTEEDRLIMLSLLRSIK